jgi:hypothetical protein
MVNKSGPVFAEKISYRNVGESEKNWLDMPSENALASCLDSMEKGAAECLTIYGKSDERLFVIGKPNFYHITIFVDESEGFGYNDGTGDSSNIEIAGDYWPSFRVCKDVVVLRSIAHEFFISGKPFQSEHWINFSDDE